MLTQYKNPIACYLLNMDRGIFRDKIWDQVAETIWKNALFVVWMHLFDNTYRQIRLPVHNQIQKDIHANNM